MPSNHRPNEHTDNISYAPPRRSITLPILILLLILASPEIQDLLERERDNSLPTRRLFPIPFDMLMPLLMMRPPTDFLSMGSGMAIRTPIRSVSRINLDDLIHANTSRLFDTTYNVIARLENVDDRIYVLNILNKNVPLSFDERIQINRLDSQRIGLLESVDNLRENYNTPNICMEYLHQLVDQKIAQLQLQRPQVGFY